MNTGFINRVDQERQTMGTHSSKGYQFDITNGAVSAVYELKNGWIKSKEIERDETWSVQGNQVTKTELDHGRLETTTYADTNGDGIYAKVSSFTLPASAASTDHHHDDNHNEHASDQGARGYRFTTLDQKISAVYEVEHGRLKANTLEFGESWSLQGDIAVKTEIEHGFTKTTIWSDTDGDGIYTRVSNHVGIDRPSDATPESHAPEGHAEHHIDLVGIATMQHPDLG
jgi:hypothetical protein